MLHNRVPNPVNPKPVNPKPMKPRPAGQPGRLSPLCRALALALAFAPVFPAFADESGAVAEAIEATEATGATEVAPAAFVVPSAPPAKEAKPARPAKAGADSPPGDIYFKQITLDEAAQFISQIGKVNIVVTSSVARKVVSLYLRDMSMDGMMKNLARAAGIWYRYDGQTKTYILMNAQEYQQDIAITRDEITRSYVLRHHNIISIAHAIQALFGDRVSLIAPVEEDPPELSGGSSGIGGSGSRSRTRTSGSSRNSVSGEGVTTRRSGGRAGAGSGGDLRKEISSFSQAGLEAALDIDSTRTENLGTSELFTAAVRQQGAPINITYNKLHNLLLARSSDEAALRDIDRLVADMDLPARQVLLEMRIVEVELGNDFRSVFDIGTSGNATSRGPHSPVSGVTSGDEYPRNAASFGDFSVGSNTAVWQIVNDRLRLRLQLLENENRVNVLAAPMLVAANNQEARLFIGDEQVLVTGASADSTTGTTGATNTTITVETEQRDVGQTLIIVPRINADRTVTLTIDQDNSLVSKGGATLPLPLPGGGSRDYPIDIVNTANLQVTAHARDGLTVAVGGMISQRVSDVEEKVPLLGDVPVLGNVFKKTVRANVRRQLVLLITPWVLDTPEESDALARKKEEQLRQLDASRHKRNDWIGGRRVSIFDVAPGSPGKERAGEAETPELPAPPVPPEGVATPAEADVQGGGDPEHWFRLSQ
jgi:general secretion pathway protein D